MFEILPCQLLRTTLCEYDQRLTQMIFNGFDDSWRHSEEVGLREKIQAIIEKFARQLNIVKDAMKQLHVNWTLPTMTTDPCFFEVNAIISFSVEFNFDHLISGFLAGIKKFRRNK